METCDNWEFPWKDRVIWSAHEHYRKLLRRLLGSLPTVTKMTLFKDEYTGLDSAAQFADDCWLELVGMFDLMPTNHHVISTFRDAILSATTLLMIVHERKVAANLDENGEDQLLISTSFEIISRLDKYDRFLASEFGLNIY